MRPKLLDLLRCPLCNTPLALDTFAVDPDDPTRVVDGLLRCEDGSHEFPVIGGVPRMILPGERRGLGERYPAFFARHRTALGAALRGECGARAGQDEVQAKIIDRFGYE